MIASGYRMVEVHRKFKRSRTVVVERLNPQLVMGIDVAGMHPASRCADRTEIAERCGMHVEHNIETLSRARPWQGLCEQRHEVSRNPLVQARKGVVLRNRNMQREELHERTDTGLRVRCRSVVYRDTDRDFGVSEPS